MKITTCYLNGPRDWDWVKKYVPLLRVEDTCGMIAVNEETGERVGAVVLDNFLNNSCQATIILRSPMVLRHGFLETCFDAIYNGFGKDYIYCLVAATNTKSLRLCERLGGIEQMRIKDGFKQGVDFIVLEIHKSRCKFYSENKRAA